MKRAKKIQISDRELPATFDAYNNTVYLKNSCALPVKINFPLVLDKNIAKLAAMMMDGSVSKSLSSCIFAQKKDTNKVNEFYYIVKKRFGINGAIRVHKRSGTPTIYYSRKVFASFLYYCLDIHKSDEPARIPKWIWKSDKSVIREYIRYAFAMEGSVTHLSKGNEIRFHSCDKSYLEELKLLLKFKFNISSGIYEYHIKNYGQKYYLRFEAIKEVRKFYHKLGFALETHQKRLKEIVENTKPKAWELTLAKLITLKKENFNVKEINELFPYLSYRAVHHRLKDLKRMEHICLTPQGYSLTKVGHEKSISLRNKIKIIKLRTNPRENERRILNFIKLKESSYKGEIARELKINAVTVRDVLKRLKSKNKIRFIYTDKFQRKFYRLYQKET